MLLESKMFVHAIFYKQINKTAVNQETYPQYID